MNSFAISKHSLECAVSSAVKKTLHNVKHLTANTRSTDFIPIILLGNGEVDVLDWHESNFIVDGHVLYRFYLWDLVDQEDEYEEVQNYINRTITDIMNSHRAYSGPYGVEFASYYYIE